MHDGNLDTLPVRYQDFSDSYPALTRFRLSQRVITPLLQIRTTATGYKTVLCGTQTRRGKRLLAEALSIHHNWVADESTIYPLPHDLQAQLARVFKDHDLYHPGFADVLAISRITQDLIQVEIAEDVFTPANQASEKIPEPVAVPGLNAELFPYQQSGVAWMQRTLRHTGGLILADEMGLGKTIQIIALLLLDIPKESSPALIICPTSLIANWKQEIFRFAPELSVQVHRGSFRAGIARKLQISQVVITTYDTALNDVALLGAINWSWIICDEAQAIKNPDSARRKALARLPCCRSIAMTGTPVENTLLDLWSLAEFAIPGILGSRHEFEKHYPDSPESAQELNRLLGPVILKRTVADVAGDLPERTDIDFPVELSEELAVHYERIRQQTLEEYGVAGGLVATGRLQMYCAHPLLQFSESKTGKEQDDALIDHGNGYSLLTPKMEMTVSIIREAFASQRKVLVFAVYNRCGELINRALGPGENVFWDSITGSTEQADRQQIIDRFTAHNGPACLVLNPRAAGAGLNITAATVVIHYTQVWNPALEAQASARAHRRGQNNPVTIYRLYYQNTVEQVMIERSLWKKELGNEAVPISTRDTIDLSRALEITPGL